MAKNPRTNRIQLNDLSLAAQEITGQEMKQVQGGKQEEKKSGGTIVQDPKTGNQFEYTLLPSDFKPLPTMDVPDTTLQITTPKKK